MLQHLVQLDARNLAGSGLPRVVFVYDTDLVWSRAAGVMCKMQAGRSERL